MSNRSDWFFRQVVTEAELNNEFTNLETAERLQMADQEWTGIQSGLDVSESTPNDFTIDVALGVCYSRDGERINIPAKQDLDVSVDENSSTTLPGVGKSRVISVFAEFDRILSDQRTDGNSNTVFFSQAESFTLVVRQGGDATSPSLPGDAEAFIASNASPIDPELILLGDIIRADTDTDITNSLVFTFRREFAFSMTAGAVTIQEGTVQDTISALLTELDNHINSSPPIHPATSIGFTPGAAWYFGIGSITATEVQGAIDQVVTDLAAGTGAQKIGTVALPGPWADGSVGPGAGLNIIATTNSIITQLAEATDATDTGAKKVGFFAAGSWADATGLTSLNVREAIDEIVDTLGDSATGQDGAKHIGSDATLSDITGANIRAQLDDLAGNWLKLTRSGQNVTGNNTFSGNNFFPDTATTTFGDGVTNCIIDGSQEFVIEADGLGIRVTDSKLELKADVAGDDARLVLYTHVDGGSGVQPGTMFSFGAIQPASTSTSITIYSGIMPQDNSTVQVWFSLHATMDTAEQQTMQRVGSHTWERNGSSVISQVHTSSPIDQESFTAGSSTVNIVMSAGGDLLVQPTNNDGSRSMKVTGFCLVSRLFV